MKSAGIREQHIIRDAFGAELLKLGEKHPDLVVITADLMYPTRTDGFARAYPARFVDVGIAEQNMVGVAAGLSIGNKRPLIASYANFACLRAGEQIRNDIAYPNLNVTVAALSSGLTFGVGGATHQSYEDIALMRALPNFTVIVASDAQCTAAAVRAAVAHDGPTYLRIGRGGEFDVYGDCPFEIGKAISLREGDDVAILACGPMVYEAVQASDALLEKGIRARVLEIHTIKPIDREAILDAAKTCRAIITAEEHNVIGGLGSAVLEVLEKVPCPVERIGLQDIFPVIGPTFELRRHYGLSAAHIADTAQKLL